MPAIKTSLCTATVLLTALLLQSCKFSMSASGDDEDSSAVPVTLGEITGSQVTATEVIGTVAINWTSTEPNRSTVDIYLSNDSGATFPVTIAARAKDTGAYTWDTNSVDDCRHCRLRIVTRDVVGNLSTPTDSSADFIVNNVPQVFGRAIYSDVNHDGPGADDTLTIPFDKEIELRTGIASDIFTFPVVGDNIGAFASVAKGTNRNELVVTFNDLIAEKYHLHVSGRFDSTKLGRTAPTGLNVRDNLSNGILFAPDTGRTAAPNVEGIDLGSGLSPTASVALTSARGASHLAVEDLNGDGRNDLIVVTGSGYTGSGGSHEVWLHTGNILSPFNTGAPSQSLASSGDTLAQVAVADVNGDNFVDVVVSRIDSVHEVWLNTGNSASPFSTAAPSQTLAASGKVRSLDLGDVNGDGHADVVMGVISGDHQVWLNTGDPLAPFETSSPSLLLSNTGSGLSTTIGDINGDTRLDVVIGGGSLYQIWLNTSDTDVPFGYANSFFLEPDSTSHEAALGDVNGDDAIDLVLSGWETDHQIWLNTGNPNTPFETEKPSQTLANASQALSLAIGDVDGDGLLDLAFGLYYEGRQEIWVNTGDATAPFVSSAPSQMVDVANSLTAEIADVDGDSDADLVVGGTANNHTIFYGSASSPSRPFFFTPDSSLSFNNSASTSTVLTGDVNGDDNPDFVVAVDGGDHQVWLNSGSDRLFGTRPSQSIENSTAASAGALGDVNGDGHLDFVVVGGNNVHKVWINTGDPDTPFDSDAPTQQLSNSVYTSCVAIGDVNGDEYLDLVAGCNNNPHQIWLNSGSATNPFSTSAPSQTLSNTAVATEVTLGDVNGDGHIDLVVGGNNHQVWLNTGSATVPFATSAASQRLGFGNTTLNAVFARSLALADVNGDEALDLIAVVDNNGLGSNDHQVWLNTGNTSAPFATTAPSQSLVNVPEVTAVAVTDANADGRLDIIVAGSAGDHQIWLNSGHVTVPFIATTPTQALPNVASTSALATGDLDGDGDEDFVVVGGESDHKVWLNDY